MSVVNENIFHLHFHVQELRWKEIFVGFAHENSFWLRISRHQQNDT